MLQEDEIRRRQEIRAAWLIRHDQMQPERSRSGQELDRYKDLVQDAAKLTHVAAQEAKTAKGGQVRGRKVDKAKRQWQQRQV